MLTPSAEAFFAARPGIEEKIIKQIPLRRMGILEQDIGPAAVFLASSDSDFITGHTLDVNGGQNLRP
jgi:NAD(P)-dependent dehydrogenase (short-subunit alcohol dehydrogenase family)